MSRGRAVLVLFACAFIVTSAGGADSNRGALPDSPLDLYAVDGSLHDLPFIGDDLSGITRNWDTGTFFVIQNSGGGIWELDAGLELLRSLSTTGFGDSEDIAYLGGGNFAIVNEASQLYLGTIGPSVSELDADDFALVVFGAPAGNVGPEGVAYDPETDRFFVVKEKSPMAVLSFPFPASAAITPEVPFDAEVVFDGRVTDLSAVTFDRRTGRLLVLSHESHRILDVGLDGTIHGELSMADATQHEGLTLDRDGSLLVTSEPNDWRRYSASADPFIFLDGFESGDTARWSFPGR